MTDPELRTRALTLAMEYKQSGLRAHPCDHLVPLTKLAEMFYLFLKEENYKVLEAEINEYIRVELEKYNTSLQQRGAVEVFPYSNRII